MRRTFIVLSILLALPILIVSIELFSKGVIYTYRNFFSSNFNFSEKLENESTEQLKTSNQNTDYLMSSDYKNSMVEDMQKLKTKFSSYIVWDQVPLNTENINIKSSGLRKNREDITAENADKVIWFLGGLYGWGFKVSDKHTIPSLLQDNINAHFENKKISVENRNIFSHQAAQTLLKFKIDLLSEKPDAIILMNGFDDYKNFWKYATIDSLDLHAHTVLTKYWNMNQNEEVIDKELLSTKLKMEIFYNTYTLYNMAKKWKMLKNYNALGIESWKKKHKKIRDEHTKMVMDYFPTYLKFYLSTMEDIANLAIDNNIDVMFIQTPMLYGSKKKLLGEEVTHYFHVGQAHFALSDNELSKLKKIPTYQLEATSKLQKKHFFDLEKFISGYEYQARELEELSIRKNVTYHDIKPVIDLERNNVVFNEFANTTAYGSKLYADSIFKELLSSNFIK